jgi:hypothetical protein
MPDLDIQVNKFSIGKKILGDLKALRAQKIIFGN